MAEPPSAWTAPGEEPDDRDPWGKPQVASPLPTPPGAPPAPAPVPPNEPAAPAAPVAPVPPVAPVAPVDPTRPVPATPPAAPGQPNWGAPPEPARPPGWGPPPGQPSQWGGQPNQWGAQPNQWGGQPGQWGGQPNQWGPNQDGAQPQWGGSPAPGNWVSRGPGIIPLRPLAIGEIYDGAIRAIRSNPRTMVGFSVIVIALLTLLATAPQAYALSDLMNNPLLDPEQSENAQFADIAGDLAGALGSAGIAVLIAVLQYVLATTIVSALLIVAVDGAVRGQALNPGQLWARCRSRLPAVLGLAILVLLALPLVIVVAMLPGVIVVLIPSGEVAGAILLVVGALAGTFAYVTLYFGFWAVAAPALLLENLGVLAALRRSYRLVRGSFWRVFGIGLLTAVIAYIIRQLFSIPFALVGGLFSSFQGDDSFGAILIQLLITDIGTVLAGAVLFPFTAGVVALLYLDLRMRREGLDVDLMRT
jgi:hypothetical protein